MQHDKCLETLRDRFKDRDWFFDVGMDDFLNLVVYVKYMNFDILSTVPDRVNSIPVLVHFAGSKTATREKFVEQNDIPFALKRPAKIEELPSSDLENDVEDLCKELDRLEKICGSNILQDIFYEVHDGKNAVTNLSAKYPEVRAGLDRLYEEYGFDVMYEEMDG